MSKRRKKSSGAPDGWQDPSTGFVITNKQKQMLQRHNVDASTFTDPFTLGHSTESTHEIMRRE